MSKELCYRMYRTQNGDIALRQVVLDHHGRILGQIPASLRAADAAALNDEVKAMLEAFRYPVLRFEGNNEETP